MGARMRDRWRVDVPSSVRWDAFVATHPQGSFLQASPWGAMKALFGWHCRRLAVFDAAGTILAGAQVLFRRSFGLAFGYTPRGPLFSGDPTVDELLIQALRRVGRQMAAIMIRFEPNISERDLRAAELRAWFDHCRLVVADTIQPRSTVLLDLQAPESALFAACSKGHRADIRRAERCGVTVRVGNEADLAPFYDIMRATGERAAFSIHSADYYATVWRLHQPNARLFIAETQATPVAAHLILADARYGYYLYGGSTTEGLRSGANHLLAWHALHWARERGCIGYDFWGIPDALGQAAFADDEAIRTALEHTAQQDPLIGVYRFKKGFGGRIVRFMPAFDLVLLPPLYPLARQKIGG
jgi:lipid II:glycine glycyltransferase (peptidoglycan interpeptide bridge formation enzyme)